MDYWTECIESSFDEAGIVATKEQIATVAGDVRVAHEQYGMAHGYDCIPNPLINENSKLKRDLETERSKIWCKVCNGTGNIIIQGPIHSSESTCWKCRGEGRVIP